MFFRTSLKDNFEAAKSIPEKCLRQRFDTKDYFSIWNPHNFSIPSLVKVFEELELNEKYSIKIREAERNIFISRFNYFRDLIKKLMGLG